jgi:hypothetical protein
LTQLAQWQSWCSPSCLSESPPSAAGNDHPYSAAALGGIDPWGKIKGELPAVPGGAVPRDIH